MPGMWSRKPKAGTNGLQSQNRRKSSRPTKRSGATKKSFSSVSKSPLNRKKPHFVVFFRSAPVESWKMEIFDSKAQALRFFETFQKLGGYQVELMRGTFLKSKRPLGELELWNVKD